MMGNDGKNKKTAPTSLTQKLPLSRPTEKMQANYFNFGAKKKNGRALTSELAIFPISFNGAPVAANGESLC